MLIHRTLALGIATICMAAALIAAAPSEVADAVMKGDKPAVRALIQRKANVNAPQVDGSTALHWAVQADDLELVSLLIGAGANATTANKLGK